MTTSSAGDEGEEEEGGQTVNSITVKNRDKDKDGDRDRERVSGEVIKLKTKTMIKIEKILDK